MAFRRRVAGFSRRRRFRTRWETDRIIGCATTYNVARNATCSDQCVGQDVPSTYLDAVPLLTMLIPFQAVPLRLPSTMATRKMRFGGMKFQSSYYTDPAEWTDSENCGVEVASVAFILSIWEAICILPLQQAADPAPAYIPELANPAKQGADLGDRLLWKRILHLPMWGFNQVQVLPQLEHTGRETADGPVIVKVRTAVDDRHGIFYVRQFVHNIVFGSQPCDEDIGQCNIPVHNNFWGTLFYRAS